MAVRFAARLLPGWQCCPGEVVVEGPALRVAASHGDEVPAAIAPLLGHTCQEVTTAGEGACALHAAWGSPEGATEQVRLGHARSVLRSTLGEVLPQVRPEMEPLLESVVSELLTDSVLPYVGGGSAMPRHEEAIFLGHLLPSAHWLRVLEAVGSHRARQENFDAEQAIAKDLSASIFVRELDSGLWSRLAMTANVAEEWSTTAWEMRHGARAVKRY